MIGETEHRRRIKNEGCEGVEAGGGEIEEKREQGRSREILQVVLKEGSRSRERRKRRRERRLRNSRKRKIKWNKGTGNKR
jgi:hypothetical protein